MKHFALLHSDVRMDMFWNHRSVTFGGRDPCDTFGLETGISLSVFLNLAEVLLLILCAVPYFKLNYRTASADAVDAGLTFLSI